MRRIPCVFTLVILLTTCSSPDEIRTHSFRIFEEDGVTIAESTGGPKYEGDLFTYEKVLTLQQDTTNTESLLFRPGDFCMDEDGFFYVTDRGNYRIAVFDREGMYSHQIGREGRGPGEFMYLEILFINDGKIAVHDMSQRRTSVFTLDGTLERVITASAEGGVGITIFPGPDLSVISIILMQYRPRNGPYGLWNRVVSISANNDTLGTFSTPRIEMGFTFSVDENSFSEMSRLYGGRSQTLYSPGRGILTTTGQESVFQYYGVDGKQMFIIRADVTRTPVTNEEGSAIRDAIRGRMESARNERMRTTYQRQLEVMEIPAFKDYWSDVDLDEYGYIWAQEPTVVYHRPENGQLSRVFSPDGEYLGTTLCDGLIGGRPSRGHYLTIIRDPESGERVPTVYRIHPAVRGLKYP